MEQIHDDETLVLGPGYLLAVNSVLDAPHKLAVGSSVLRQRFVKDSASKGRIGVGSSPVEQEEVQ
jgi:hypothetical protein